MILTAMLPLLLACGEGDDTGAANSVTTDAGLYTLDVTMQPDPPTAGDATLTIELNVADSGDPEVGAALTVTPWMPDHGHGIDEAPTVTEDDGTYTVEFVYSMPGAWELTVDIDGSAGTDSVVLEVEVQ